MHLVFWYNSPSNSKVGSLGTLPVTLDSRSNTSTCAAVVPSSLILAKIIFPVTGLEIFDINVIGYYNDDLGSIRISPS